MNSLSEWNWLLIEAIESLCFQIQSLLSFSHSFSLHQSLSRVNWEWRRDSISETSFPSLHQDSNGHSWDDKSEEGGEYSLHYCYHFWISRIHSRLLSIQHASKLFILLRCCPNREMNGNWCGSVLTPQCNMNTNQAMGLVCIPCSRIIKWRWKEGYKNEEEYVIVQGPYEVWIVEVILWFPIYCFIR